MTDDTRRQEIRLRDPKIVGELLGRICDEVDEVEHVVLTSRDGLAIASDSTADVGGEKSFSLHGSALAAAVASIGDHFVELVNRGRLRGVLFDVDDGCVGVYPISATLLLVVFGESGVTPGRFGAAVKKSVGILLAPDQ